MLQSSTEKPFEVVWRPLKGSQTFAVDTRAHDTLYEGTRGPGKTAAQLMRYRRRVGLGYGAYWRGVIFDREFKNLADIVAQSERFYKRFEDGAHFLKSASEYKWVWPTGEELLFRHVKKLADYDAYHGHEYPFIGWNELTKQPTSELFDKFMSTNRSSFMPLEHTPRDKDGEFLTPDRKPLPNIPLETFSTTNPNGPGHNWVKRRFISIAPSGTVVRKSIPIFNPQTQKDEIFVRTQVAIFGSYRENPYLDPKYVAELNSITDPNLRRAWLGGDWDVVSGGAFDDVWRTEVHRVERFKVPASWYVDRSFDWGSTHPFFVGWFAQANGEEVILPSGKVFCPQRGSLILINELYGTDEIGTNKGVKWSATKVAEKIIEKEIAMMQHGWVAKQPWPGPADNQIRNVVESDVDTIEKKMADKGVRWEQSDKSPGSRINGLQIMRDMLQAAVLGEGPGLYFMSNCEAALETIPVLPRDEDKPDDIDTTAEDHPYDGVRYRALRGANRITQSVNIQIPH